MHVELLHAVLACCFSQPSQVLSSCLQLMSPLKFRGMVPIARRSGLAPLETARLASLMNSLTISSSLALASGSRSSTCQQ